VRDGDLITDERQKGAAAAGLMIAAPGVWTGRLPNPGNGE
jgi:hypothetical protein